MRVNRLVSKVFSFTPGFSPVERQARIEKPFKRFPANASLSNTGLKPGENEKAR
jgi:hypothetical protein